MRVILAARTDTHGGHRLGLMNPDVVLFEEDVDGNLVPWTPALTPTQKQIWDWSIEDRDKVKALAGDDEIILFDLADITHGNHFNRELVSTRQADQYLIAVANFSPWMELPNLKKVRILKGTGIHEFGEGSAPVIVADMLRREHPDKDIQVPYHLLADVGGVKFDLAHHGAPPGVRNWLRGNILVLYTQSIMLDDLLDGLNPPDVVLRGHYHQYVTRVASVEARGKTWETRATILPSYCFTDDHARKAARSPSRTTIGLVAYEIVDGRLAGIHPFKRTVDFRTKEVMA